MLRKYNRAERVEVLSKEEGAKIARKLGRVTCTCDTPFRDVCDVHGTSRIKGSS